MNKLNQLTTLLNKINDHSSGIIDNVYPIIKELKKDDSELIEDLLDDVDIEKSEGLKILRGLAVSLIEDATKITREIDSFTNAILQGDDIVENNVDNYPFLAEVWFGDLYGESDIEALQILEGDIYKQYMSSNEDAIYDNAVKIAKKQKKKS